MPQKLNRDGVIVDVEMEFGGRKHVADVVKFQKTARTIRR
jgi:hypothetical protein